MEIILVLDCNLDPIQGYALFPYLCSKRSVGTLELPHGQPILKRTHNLQFEQMQIRKVSRNYSNENWHFTDSYKIVIG